MSELFVEFWENFSRPENIVGHIAYVLLIVSMMMRNMNWLRALAIMAGTISAVFYFTLADYVSMFWESLFALVNLVQLLILQVENRLGRLNSEEKFFIKACLSDVERAHSRKLVKIGAWTQVQNDSILITEATSPEDLKFVVSGNAKVLRNNKLIGMISKGDFIGEMSYLTGKQASATVISTDPVRFIAFDRKRLKDHLDRNPEVRHALEASFNRNLVEKLVKTNDKAIVDSTSNG